VKLGGPSSKAKYKPATDSELVPRGKGEKNPGEGSEKYLKPSVYKQWKNYWNRRGFALLISGSTAYLLHNGSASYSVLQG
jgi:hypothetical protein